MYTVTAIIWTSTCLNVDELKIWDLPQAGQQLLLDVFAANSNPTSHFLWRHSSRSHTEWFEMKQRVILKKIVECLDAFWFFFFFFCFSSKKVEQILRWSQTRLVIFVVKQSEYLVSACLVQILYYYDVLSKKYSLTSFIYSEGLKNIYFD